MEIIDFKPEHQPRFRDLNLQWIRESFEVEDIDYKVLNFPDEYILKDGGSILLASENGEIIGACALMNEGHGIFELTKMAVDVRFRGKRIGYELAIAAIQKARDLNAEKLILFSNTVHNSNAISLYRKVGFKEVPFFIF
jgi:ribosomal protein S18 acetylase RimI-like enzyme